MDKKDIASYNLEELTQEMKTLGEEALPGQTDLCLAPSEAGRGFPGDDGSLQSFKGTAGGRL